MERLATLVSHLCHSAPAPQPTAAAAAGGSRDHNHHDHVLVVGGTGLIGRAAAEHFASSSSPLRGGRHVTTISRRALPYSLPDPSRHTHLELDLCDREACLSAMRALPTPVTHLIYAAMGTTTVDADPSNGTAIDVGDQSGRALNSTMFDNLLNALERTGGGDDEGALHVQLLQGRLAYGGWAVAPSLFPSREDRPDRSPSWYFDQEDQLRARLKLHPLWRATLWRPPAMLGHAAGGHLNMVAALGAWAALRRARGQTMLPRPAASAGLKTTFADQLCDVRLLSAAMGWAAASTRDPTASQLQIYNIDNGDVVAWEALFAVVAAVFGMQLEPTGPAEPLKLATELTTPEADMEWRALATEHDLIVPSLPQLLGNSAVFTDIMVGGPALGDTQSQEGGYNASLKNKAKAAARGETLSASGEGLMVVGPLMSSLELRKSGFYDVLSTEESMEWWLKHLQETRVLPL